MHGGVVRGQQVGRAWVRGGTISVHGILPVHRQGLVWIEGASVLSICRAGFAALLRLGSGPASPTRGPGEMPQAASQCLVLSID